MKKLLITLAAGAATLALAGVASAEEANVASTDQPILLTTDQMDGVTAGTAGGFWTSYGDATVEAYGFSDNIPGYYAEADLTTYTYCFSGVCETDQGTFAVVDGN